MARWSLETLYLPGFREFIRLNTVSRQLVAHLSSPRDNRNSASVNRNLEKLKNPGNSSFPGFFIFRSLLPVSVIITEPQSFPSETNNTVLSHSFSAFRGWNRLEIRLSSTEANASGFRRFSVESGLPLPYNEEC